MKDKYKLFEPNDAKGLRSIAFTDVSQIDEAKIKEYIQEAVEINKKGMKVPQKEVEIPSDFKKALKDADLLEIFESYPFTHRKEFVRSVVDAKKPETRERRIQKNVEMIRMKGKDYNKQM